MFTIKKAALVFLLLALGSIPLFADEFDDAVINSRERRLTEVSPVGKGVPFFTEKTLDPVWDEDSRPVIKISDFSLIDQDGKPQNEKMFDGKVTFVAFFFSSCAGFCPTLLKNLQDVEASLQKKYKGLRFVAISVDPQRDQPKNLKAYFKKMKFSKDWTLLTGDENKIYSFAHDTLAAEAFKLPKSKGQISHSEHFYVLDERRRLRGVLKGTRLDVADKALALMASLKGEFETSPKTFKH